MTLVRRKRKQIRLTEAAEILGIGKTTMRIEVIERKLTTYQRKPGTTSPVMLLVAEVDAIAKERGLL